MAWEVIVAQWLWNKWRAWGPVLIHSAGCLKVQCVKYGLIYEFYVGTNLNTAHKYSAKGVIKF